MVNTARPSETEATLFGHTNQVTCLAPNPNSSRLFATTGTDGRFFIWDLKATKSKASDPVAFYQKTDRKYSTLGKIPTYSIKYDLGSISDVFYTMQHKLCYKVYFKMFFIIKNL